MNVIYFYLANINDGSLTHINNFMHSFNELGETIVDAGIITEPFTVDKKNWSSARRILAKLIWLKRNITILFYLLDKLHRNKCDLILFRFMSNHQFFFAIFFLSFFYPVVLEINAIGGIENSARSGLIFTLLDRIILWRSKRFFVVSKVLRDFFAAHYKTSSYKVVVVENGVDEVLFNPSERADHLKHQMKLDGRYVVGFVGTFKPWHGFSAIVSLAEQVVPLCPDIAFLVVGDGEKRKEYESRIESLGLSSHFVFVGHVPYERIPDYLSIMDVALATHRSDSFEKTGGFHGSPLKLFEYMAMAKAIIATPVGQIAEIIEDGKSGRLIHSENTVSMRNEILRMYAEPKYREKLGLNARRVVEKHYTWKINAEKIREICRDAIAIQH